MLKSEAAVNRALTKMTRKENKDPGGLVIKEEAEEPPSRSSPDSSTDPWHCNGNKIIVVPPQSPEPRTRCPVCRKHVSDLSHHFAVEHSDNVGNGQEATEHPSPTTLISTGATTSLRRIIPIVLPNGQNQAESIPTNGDLNNVTIIPMSTNRNYASSGASGTRSSTPHSMESNDNHPVNLSVRKDSSEMENLDDSASNYDANGMYIAQATSALGRKRRKQTHVPDGSKDEKYWARRLKNNEAAKKSRDMRIRREKVIFEENMRLESMVKELRTENDALSTENKELQLKLGFILDENVRLQSLIPGKES